MQVQHRLRRVVLGDLLRCEELVVDADENPLLVACHAYSRAQSFLYDNK